MASRPLLLDTHAALWLADGSQFSSEGQAALEGAELEGAGIYLSPISMWEIGLLLAKDRIALDRSPSEWERDVISLGVRWAELAPQTLVESSFLPGKIHADPADRILAATARSLGLSLLTRDEKLLSYAAAGHMRAIPC